MQTIAKATIVNEFAGLPIDHNESLWTYLHWKYKYSLKIFIDNNFLTIGTFVELVTILFMRIDLEAVWFWTTCLG